MNKLFSSGSFAVLLVALLLAGLPVAAWLDVSNLAENNLRREARDLNSIMNGIRAYYATNIVDHILAVPGTAKAVHDYEDVPGAIPIPATLSLELGKVVGEQQQDISYRYVSDYPFKNRAPHVLDQFETDTLARLRQNPDQQPAQLSSEIFDDRIRLVSPLIMGQACVSCHNSHPDSPKLDWKVGDVRGIQEISITQPLGGSIFAFKYLSGYFVLTAMVGSIFILSQRRHVALINGMSAELDKSNEFLAALPGRLSRRFANRAYEAVLGPHSDVIIHAERKKLTVFFSSTADLTSAAAHLRPDQITQVVNDCLSEMSAIAAAHGGTIDASASDAMLIFFGHPKSKGEAEDAKACLRMAVAMQRQLADLDGRWRRLGLEHPPRIRIGVNTGYCNVGSDLGTGDVRYALVGAEANLAARLQSIATPGDIVVGDETYVLTRDRIVARALDPIMAKGIGREVVPYLLGDIVDL